jgi:SAM-dependent methyltransferase
LWEIAGEWLEHGAMQRQAREKPRGYAGDYDLLAKICTHWFCDHPLGGAFDRFFQNLAAPQAVRARTELIAAWMAQQCLRRFDQGKECRLVSVGSGPALDVYGALAMIAHRDRCSAVLLDLDPESLDYAQRRLEPLMPSGSVVVLRENLFRLPQRPDRAELLGNPDFLVCSGLFDYLDAGPAEAMLGLFWRRLAPGGQLVVGNFAPHNPTRAYMEWIGNWYLLYRTPDQVRQLALAAGIPEDRMTITAERTGVDLLLVAEKEEP